MIVGMPLAQRHYLHAEETKEQFLTDTGHMLWVWHPCQKNRLEVHNVIYVQAILAVGADSMAVRAFDSLLRASYKLDIN